MDYILQTWLLTFWSDEQRIEFIYPIEINLHNPAEY